MAEFVEVMKERDRMCETYIMCEGCGLLVGVDNEPLEPCRKFFNEHPQESEKIIMDWAKEHPVTNKDKLYQIVKESFGEEIADNFKAIFEKNSCFATQCKHEDDCKKCENRNFWQQEWKDPKEKADE